MLTEQLSSREGFSSVHDTVNKQGVWDAAGLHQSQHWAVYMSARAVNLAQLKIQVKIWGDFQTVSL